MCRCMKDIKEAPLDKEILFYLRTTYGVVKNKGIIKSNNNIDVSPYFILELSKDRIIDSVVSFKNILGWDYLKDE